MNFNGRIFNGEGRYLSQSTLRIVSAVKICVRKPSEKELEKEGIFEYSYVIENSNHGGVSRKCSHSDMELLCNFANHIEDISAPISLNIKFDYDKEKYPYNDPVYGIESIVNVHNKQAGRFHIRIDNTSDNPFSERPSRCITEEQAYELIEKTKKE